MSQARLPLVLVAAVACNHVIGDGERLLWHLRGDLQHFRARTLGKPLIMGRRTFQSIGKPLPGRQTIVVTRHPAFHPAGVLIAANLDDDIGRAGEIARREGHRRDHRGGRRRNLCADDHRCDDALHHRSRSRAGGRRAVPGHRL